ncbi:hypothetical protein MNV_590033 [Candidatus Methanoperedens nitroreducens]|uniref:Uncharacterized protein n=1 Tax=Candidatus Methanoperedens nitratireducens TaxID=1392998 RepID=A0A284VS38_9EURY|nr:hypothetical protein MNV_590033 [Candidatus Methanoperedens nitroreducens]
MLCNSINYPKAHDTKGTKLNSLLEPLHSHVLRNPNKPE